MALSGLIALSNLQIIFFSLKPDSRTLFQFYRNNIPDIQYSVL